MNLNVGTLLFSVILGVFFALFVSLLTVTGFGLSYYHTWFEIILAMAIVAALTKDAGVIIVVGFLFFSTSIVNIISSSVMNSEAYVRSLEVKDSNLSEFQTDPKAIREVTLDMANTLANKIIGQKVNGVQLSSQYQLNLNVAAVQEVNGSLIWVIPLDYAGFAKWYTQSYVPGYVTMSATDPRSEPKLILNKKIIVSDNGYFGQNVSRKVWFRSGMKSSISHMEIDDKGNVYWISPIIKPSIGMSLDTVTSVLVMNAETGESTDLSISDTMKKYPWIDRIWPESIIKERVEAYGALQNGWMNTMFGETNVNKPTEYNGAEFWLIKAGGKLQWFTGMTSVQSDKSLVSGILIEANGGVEKPILREVSLSGVTDEHGAVDAIDSGLGADSVKWNAVIPQPVMVNGKFFWHASIVSGNNIYQKSGLVQGDDISNVYFGSTLDDSLNNIMKPIVSGQKGVVVDSNSSEAIVAKILVKIDELDALKKALIASKKGVK
jgi:hypothetical protein